jgi:hypothetical protein
MNKNGQLFLRLYREATLMATASRGKRLQHSDLVVAAVYLWGVLHDRPQGWGCAFENWSIPLPWLSLPSESCLSRRLRSPGVKALLDALCDYLWGRFRKRIAKCVDGRPLLVSRSSKDKTACIGPYGRSTAKGYKLHVIVDGGGVLIAWALAPLNHGESTVAGRLCRRLAGMEGYLAGDSNYDYNRLYELAHAYGHQLVAPRKKGGGLGHMRHSPRRLRGLELLQRPVGDALRGLRKCGIERFFGNLGWKAGGLSALPGFVRSLKRVRRWVQAKLIFQALNLEKSLELA